MRIAWEHYHALDPVSADFIVDDFVRAFLAQLYKPVSGYDDELFPFRMMPVLSLGDAGFGYVYGYLSAVQGMDQFREAAPFVCVHLQVEYRFLLRQIAQICAEQAFGKTVGRHFRYHEGFLHVGKTVKQVHYFTQLHVMRDRCGTVASVGLHDCINSVELAMMFLAFESTYHLLYQVINVEQFHVDIGVIDLDGKAVGYVVAERGHGTVVVGPAPLAVKVGKAIDQHLRPGLPAVFEEQLLAGLLAPAVLAVPETAGKRGLDAGTEHHRASVPVYLKGLKQSGSEPEIALHELLIVFWTIHSCKVEHKVALLTPSVQLFRCGLEVVFIYFRHGKVAVASGLPVLYVVELCTQILPYEAFCSGY